MTADGSAKPAGGTLTAFEPPSGRACGSTPSATPATAPVPLRLAARQGHRAQPVGRLRRRARQGRARARASSGSRAWPRTSPSCGPAGRIPTSRRTRSIRASSTSTPAKLSPRRPGCIAALYFEAAAAPPPAAPAGRRAGRRGRPAGGAGVRQGDAAADRASAAERRAGGHRARCPRRCRARSSASRGGGRRRRAPASSCWSWKP